MDRQPRGRRLRRLEPRARFAGRSMIYADLPASAAVFLDASVFIHHFEPNALYGPPATEFLERIENQEIAGITTTHIVSEVAHRLMTLEAMQAFGWKSAGIALRLR